MISLKNRYLKILLSSLFTSGFCGVLTEANPPVVNTLKMQSKKNERRLKESSDKEFLAKVYRLAALVAHENEYTHKIKLESLTFEMVDPSELPKLVDAHIDTMPHNSRGRNQEVHIQFNRNVKTLTCAEQTQTILHELAHAYDIHLWNNICTGDFDPGFDRYPYLKNDMQRCKTQFRTDSPEMMASEWYAEWKALQWMKKYTPQEVPQLKRLYEELAVDQKRGSVIDSFCYPPEAILLQWLS